MGSKRTGHQRKAGESQGPPQIRARHRARLAIVYVRTATIAAEDGIGAQRALADLPRIWGWPTARIRIIDQDSGRSGASVADREGFQRLRALIRRGRVGLVLVRDTTRLSRNVVDRAMLLVDAAEAGVVVLATEPVLHDLTAS